MITVFCQTLIIVTQRTDSLKQARDNVMCPTTEKLNKKLDSMMIWHVLMYLLPSRASANDFPTQWIRKSALEALCYTHWYESKNLDLLPSLPDRY